MVFASLFFYAWWNPIYLPLLLASIATNYVLACGIHAYRSKALLVVGVALNLALIGYFKYAGFFVSGVNDITGSSHTLNTIILPLGISFFTFQQITFLVDTWTGNAKRYSLLDYCQFVTFFPQLIAGPIVHHHEMMPQFQQTTILANVRENLSVGLSIFIIDFLSFNVLARADGPAAGYVEGRLKTLEDSSRYWPDYLAATVSADALTASMSVLRTSENPTHRVLNGRGGREDKEIDSRLSDGGHRTNSQKIERFFVDSVLLAAPHRRFAVSSEHDDSLLWFERLVDEVQRLGIKTTLVIGPSHTCYWELLHQGGLWSQYEQWKTALVSINQKIALAQKKPELPFWDFSLPNAITSEVFPQAEDSDTKMQYYYEAVHFNQRAGGLMLDRISGQFRNEPSSEISGALLSESLGDESSDLTSALPDNAATVLPANFGVVLNENSLTRINAELSSGLKKFRTQYPETVQELLLSLPSGQ